MTESSLIFTLGLGFMLGLRHATEADHVVAVATIVSERRSVLASAVVGMYWGIGHTLSLLVAMLAVLALGMAIPDDVAGLLEFGVAVMIIGLGLRLLWLTATGKDHVHHDAEAQQGSRPATGWRNSLKAVLVGAMHGLAGSAALIVLIQAEVMRQGGTWQGLAYLVLFGIGSMIGMGLMGSVIGLPFALRRGSGVGLARTLSWLAGIGSVLFGLWYGWQSWPGG
ncbi:MAG: urease accessory protein [Gammaproteobacteria bacterium]|nr:urease accessory protein [Gammaproteobacteria bacterium]